MGNGKVRNIGLSLEWQSAVATHCDRHYEKDVSLELDRLPDSLGEALLESNEAHGDFPAGRLTPPHDPDGICDLDRSAFNQHFGGQVSEARVGRFYPRAMIAGAIACSTRDYTPFRLVGQDSDKLRIDLNHPLSLVPLTLSARIPDESVRCARSGRGEGGVLEVLTSNGPGMQAPCRDVQTDFFSGSPFQRDDESSDVAFYEMPRFVNHIDTVAMSQVTAIYTRLLKPGTRVLDLMSSWTSHLSPALEDVSVVGLGMNREELERNDRLSDRIVYNLNETPTLPMGDRDFDAVVCTVSVEYLVHPFEVFADVARILKPGGLFAVTFSNRWFPPKAIRLWGELHPFERMGVVLDYFRKSGQFVDLHTESVRGLERPPDDKYASRMKQSDPVFAVWGYSKS